MTQVDLDGPLARWLAPHAERRAEPRGEDGSWLPRFLAGRAPLTAKLERYSPAGDDPATGIISPRCLVGIDQDGRRPAGALPWHWCYGNQPVSVKGAVYADSNEAAHLVRGISEAVAMRADRDAWLRSVGAAELSRTAIRRHLRKGRGR